MASQTDRLICELKKRWMSNIEACDFIHSAHGDRRLRSIRADHTPAGWKFVSKPTTFKMDEKAKTVHYNKYKLVKV